MSYSKFDKSYIKMAEVIAEQSYCLRGKVGAILVNNGGIISEGYNGTPSGFDNTAEISLNPDEPDITKVSRDELKTKPEVIHAESNAILKCAKYGRSTNGSTLYVTHSPCVECAKLIIQSGIKRVVYKDLYKNEDGLNLLRKANIEILKF